VAKTQVNAEAETIKFVAKGKEILSEGWRVLFSRADENKDEKEHILPTFEVGERGPHKPSFLEKSTKPPNNYTEATLLRAMESAGKQVEDDELRELMKANGIGRPSTRANIIETLFKRKYALRKKKQVLPTEMGIQLIGTIQNDLLKSAELTGQWEKQLKEIEQGEFGARQFILNMKNMVNRLVYDVRNERGKPRLASLADSKSVSQSKTIQKGPAPKTKTAGMTCPKCSKGIILKGKSSFGCNQWKEGCDFRVPFIFMNKKLTDKQVQRLIEKRATTKIKGFVLDGEKAEGVLTLNDKCEIEFENKTKAAPKKETEMPACPKCSTGTLIKGNAAYGCSRWKEGCDFRFSFADIKAKAQGKTLTKELVLKIIGS
jgi:DNA topoisomerase-3